MSDQALLIDVPQHAGVEDENARFTLDDIFEWAKKRADVEKFQLDVAACEEAHRAERWYSKEQDGLSLQWWGNVWCNPPWSDIEPWVVKAWLETMSSSAVLSVAMLLPGDRRHRPWWQRHVEPYRDRRQMRAGVALETHDPPTRPAYGHPGNPRGIGCAEPNFTSVLLVWKRTPEP